MWSQPWYPDDAVRRRVQISWSFALGSENCHESILPHDPSEMRRLLFPNLQNWDGHRFDVDGYISIIADNEELLGERFWVYDPRLLRHGLGRQSFWKSGQSITVEPVTDTQVLFRRQSTDHKTRTKRLPSEAFVEEWNLMLLRVERIRTDCTGEQLGPLRHYDQYVRRALIDYTLTAELAMVLKNPVPSLDENGRITVLWLSVLAVFWNDFERTRLPTSGGGLIGFELLDDFVETAGKSLSFLDWRTAQKDLFLAVFGCQKERVFDRIDAWR